jgi:hypothetical protein
MVKPIVCAALLLAVLAHTTVPMSGDSSMYADYVDIGEVPLVEIQQGSSTTFSVMIV